MYAGSDGILPLNLLKGKIMSYRINRLMTAILLVTVLGVGLIILTGCKKKEQPAAPTAIKQAAAAAAEQTVCPVLSGPVNKSIFTEYQGKKVYFCCAQCLDTFNADPNKYVDKLPQFKK